MGERIRNKEETMENDKEKEVSIECGAGMVLGTDWLDALRFWSGAALTGTWKLPMSHFADVVPWAGVALPWAKKVTSAMVTWYPQPFLSGVYSRQAFMIVLV